MTAWKIAKRWVQNLLQPTTVNRQNVFKKKKVDIELESFLLDPDSSEGIKALGKGRKNVIMFNCKRVVQ